MTFYTTPFFNYSCMVRIIFCFVFMHSLLLNGISQSTVSPILGVDFTYLLNPNCIYEIQDNFWESKSLILGISTSHNLTKSLKISLLSTYTKKEFQVSTRAIIPVDKLKFNYLRNNILLGFPLSENIDLSVGPSLNLLTNFKYLNKGKTHEELNLTIDYGISSEIGYRWKKYLFNLHYFYGIKRIRDNVGRKFNPIISVGLGIGYEFKI